MSINGWSERIKGAFSGQESQYRKSENEVVRNSKGRIVQTGWPFAQPDLWPEAYTEIFHMHEEQKKYEKLLMDIGEVDAFGAIRYGGNLVFNLSAITLRDKLIDNIHAKVNSPGLDREAVRVCDIGGGDGNLLGNVMYKFRSKYALPNLHGREVRTTMTSLTDFGVGYSNREAVDDYVISGVELPPDNFYEAFDVIAAQNSVYYWSLFPELATLNIYKMLKPNGVAVVTVPGFDVPVHKEKSFSMMDYLRTNPYLEIRHIEQLMRSDGYIVEMGK